MPSSSPFWLVRRIADEMDRLFEEMAGGIAPPPGSGFERAKGWGPPLETCETGDRLLVRVDLPGVRPEDVGVDVTESEICISGTRAPQQTAGEQPLHRSERPFGEFRRSVALPAGADPDATTASFRDGVLEISVPLMRRERRKGRRVPVERDVATPAPAAQKAEADAAAARARDVVEENPEKQSSG